jgi:hypothetical protein
MNKEYQIRAEFTKRTNAGGVVEGVFWSSRARQLIGVRHKRFIVPRCFMHYPFLPSPLKFL